VAAIGLSNCESGALDGGSGGGISGVGRVRSEFVYGQQRPGEINSGEPQVAVGS
jgi:hypothetical protein